MSQRGRIRDQREESNMKRCGVVGQGGGGGRGHRDGPSFGNPGSGRATEIVGRPVGMSRN